jgi:hypothetical protein
MNNKTFGIVVGIIIALAVSMFAGLYMLGLSDTRDTSFNDGYEYNYTSSYYPYDTVDGDLGLEALDHYHYEDYDYYYEDDPTLYEDSGIYFDETTGTYDLDDYQFETLEQEYYFAE